MQHRGRLGGAVDEVDVASAPIERAARRGEPPLCSTCSTREVKAGHDGTWVAHPGLIPLAKDIFDEQMPGDNQTDRARDDVKADADFDGEYERTLLIVSQDRDRGPP